MRIDFEKQTEIFNRILNGEKVEVKLDRIFGMTIPGFLQYLKEEKEKAGKVISEELYDYAEDLDYRKNISEYEEDKKVC